MARSAATTVDQYLAELPPERRGVIAAMRDLVLRHLPEGYEEVMNWGMISYEVPLARYPDSYNKQPLAYAGLAAQKNHFALYLNCVQGGGGREAELRAAFTATGRKLDMGKSCVRFRRVEDLELDALGRVIASTPPESFIAEYEAAMANRPRRA
ncbi:MAG: DUF1801 domain-containing protein [Gemmatimonadaceae bacterium]